MAEGQVTIKAEREKPVRNQHPWVFSGAVAKVKSARDGDIVTVVDSSGSFLGRGYFNQKSQIQVRILTWHDEQIDETWWRESIQKAISLRAHYLKRDGNLGIRLINAENDYMPGLIVDQYGDTLVLQAQTLFIDDLKKDIAQLLLEITGAKGVYERSDIDARSKEGLHDSVGVLAGDAPPERITIIEYGTTYEVDIRKGHKTGFYLDQRENRRILAEQLAQRETPSILNLFCYTGGFGVSALHAGATQIVNVDSSHDALELAVINSEKNGAASEDERIEYIEADCFGYLRDVAAQNRQFDVIVLDPPKFAHSAQQVDKAARGYKDLNLHAFKCVKPGGLLMTYSCSGAISRDLFQKIVFGALADSGRQAQIIQHLGAADDHPIALTFPEGEYLKGLLVRVI